MSVWLREMTWLHMVDDRPDAHSTTLRGLADNTVGSPAAGVITHCGSGGAALRGGKHSSVDATCLKLVFFKRGE